MIVDEPTTLYSIPKVINKINNFKFDGLPQPCFVKMSNKI